MHSTSREVCPCMFTTICLALHQLRSSCSFCLRSSASFSARRAASLQGPEYNAPRRAPVSTKANGDCYNDCSYIAHTSNLLEIERFRNLQNMVSRKQTYTEELEGKTLLAGYFGDINCLHWVAVWCSKAANPRFGIN